MKDQNKTKAELIEELEIMRSQVSEIEKLKSERRRIENRLRDTEEKYRFFADNSVDVIWKTDLRLKFSFVSPSIFATGYTQNEWVGTHLYEHTSKKDFFKMARQALSAIKNYKTFDKAILESKFIKKNGEEYPVIIIGRVLLNDKGLPIGLHGSTHNITDRKQAEEALSESQNFKETLLNTSPNIIYIYDLIERKNVYSNEGIMTLLGYSIEEVREMGDNLVSELMHPEDFKVYLDETVPRYQTAKDGELIEHEYRMKHKNGSWLWLHAKESIFNRLGNGKPKQIFGVNGDITENKLIKAALQESMEKYRALYENSPLSYQSLDEDGSFIDVNPAWLRLLGYDQEEVIGKPYADFLHPDLKLHFEKNFHEFKKRGTISDVQFKIRHKDGRYFDISFEGCVGYNPDGSFKQTYCVFQNITERKLAEKKLYESEDRYDLAMSATEDGVYDWNLLKMKFTILRVGRACWVTKMTNYQMTSLFGKN